MKIEHWSYFSVSHLNHWKCRRVLYETCNELSTQKLRDVFFPRHVHILAIAPAVHVVLSFNKAIRRLEQVMYNRVKWWRDKQQWTMQINSGSTDSGCHKVLMCSRAQRQRYKEARKLWM